MSRYIIFTLIVVFVSCKQSSSPPTSTEESYVYQPITDEMMESAVIYEANIRQYSAEGTFAAFANDIPTLKELGVKIIWVMPIHPISTVKRKATGDTFATDIADPEERKKYLGSYYSVADYKAVNPEFGTLDDFKELVQTAHDHGINVIIDWVPNHTGWDHPWITDHPEWYTQNQQGEIIDPIDPHTGESWGWTDVADLNYDNHEMRQEMISDMKFWVEEADIDGFRVDVAHQVPPSFFKNAIEELEGIKPLFMLAEAEQADLFTHGFDMHYAWEGHHLLNRIAKNQSTGTDFQRYIQKQEEELQPTDFSMNFITNHDENSWAGPLNERMPINKGFFTSLIYTMPGMPLIYSGQEYDLSHRLKFFEKDQIPKDKRGYYDLLVKLGALKNQNKALHGGKNAASYESLTSDSELIAFRRKKDGDQVIFIGNLSGYTQHLTGLLTGNFNDYLQEEQLILDRKSNLSLGPWQYKILVAE